MNDGARRVLAVLRESGPTPYSGESLSASLGVSRAQIWKHIGALRKLGYEIAGAPGGGYELVTVPDRLYDDEIQQHRGGQWVGSQIHHLDDTDSTNRVALELGRAGATNGLAVIAESQSAGRGRLGRSFYSPPHCNLYTSIILRPDLELSEAPTLILAAGIAVAEAVAETVADDAAVTLKWPNDVLLGGLKTSGILLELAAEEARVGFVVMGIGVNLNVDRASFPDEFRATATSLSSHLGKPVERAAFTGRLYDILEGVLDEHAKGGFAALRSRFDRRFDMPGKRVEVVQMNGSEPLCGTVRGVAADGALELETEAGEIHRVVAGDVTLSKTPRTDRTAPNQTTTQGTRPKASQETPNS